MAAMSFTLYPAIDLKDGQCVRLVRGDMLTLWDTRGQGHKIEVVGEEPCHFLMVALPDKGEFS